MFFVHAFVVVVAATAAVDMSIFDIVLLLHHFKVMLVPSRLHGLNWCEPVRGCPTSARAFARGDQVPVEEGGWEGLVEKGKGGLTHTGTASETAATCELYGSSTGANNRTSTIFPKLFDAVFDSSIYQSSVCVFAFVPSLKLVDLAGIH